MVFTTFNSVETTKVLGALRTSSIFRNASAHLIHDLSPFAQRRQVKPNEEFRLEEPCLLVVLEGSIEDRDDEGRLEREIQPGELFGDRGLFQSTGPIDNLRSPNGAELLIISQSSLAELPRQVRHDLGLAARQTTVVAACEDADGRALASQKMKIPALEFSVDDSWDWVCVSAGPQAGAAPIEGLTKALAQTIREDFQEPSYVISNRAGRWYVHGHDVTVDRLSQIKGFGDSRPHYALVVLKPHVNPRQRAEVIELSSLHIILTGVGPMAAPRLSDDEQSRVLRTVLLNRQLSRKTSERVLHLSAVASVRARECRIEFEPEDLARLAQEDDEARSRLSRYAKESLSRWARFVTRRAVGVALGGGGAWGYFHVALLQKICEANVPVDLTSGTSFGSLVSVYFAAKGLDGLHLLTERGETFARTQLLSMFTTRFLERQISEDLERADLSRLPIASNPFTTNLTHLRGEAGVAGPVALGARASSSAPGVFAPTVLSKAGVFVDGVITGNVPYGVLVDQGADLLVASNAVPQPSSCPVPSSRAGRVFAAVSPLHRIMNSYRSALLALYEVGTEPPHFSQVFVQANRTIEKMDPVPDPSSFLRAKEIVNASRESEDLLGQVDNIVSRWQALRKPRA